jgi:hypothetical protein
MENTKEEEKEIHSYPIIKKSRSKRHNFLGLFLLLLLAVSFGGGFYLGQEKNNLNRQVALGEATTTVDEDAFDFNVYWEAWDALRSNFVYKNKIKDKEMFYDSVKGLAASADDPYTVFMTPTETKEFANDLAGTFEGIGAEVGMRNEIITIVAPLAGIVMKEGIDRLIDSSRAFVKVLGAINEGFRQSPDFNNLRDRSEIQPYEVSDLYYYLTGSHYGNQYAPSHPSAPAGWYGAPMWPDVEGQSFLDCVDVNMIRNHYRTRDPVYYRHVTNNLPPDDRTDEIFIDRFYKDKRRRRPQKNCSNVPYVTTIDRARMDKFLGEKRRMHVTVMTTGIVAHRKTPSQSHLKPV